MRKYITTLGLASLCVAAAPATQPVPSAPASLSKLAWMTGSWQGGGWVEYQPGQRQTFTSTEIVAPKIGGHAIAVEGKHFSNGQIVHDAFAVIAEENGALTFRAYLADGRKTLAKARVLENNSFEWTLETPQALIRYTITQSPEGKWIEKGELTIPGQPARQVFEMVLTKVVQPG